MIAWNREMGRRMKSQHEFRQIMMQKSDILAWESRQSTLDGDPEDAMRLNQMAQNMLKSPMPKEYKILPPWRYDGH